MSEQDLSFLPFFLREPIYVVPEAAPAPQKETLPALPHLGEGKQGILLLVHEPDHVFLAPDDQAFLEKDTAGRLVDAGRHRAD